jgi:hypothetical protein
MSENTTCNVCAFYESHAANDGKASENAGLCRFNPPMTQPEPNARGLWPVVTSSDWCGHFSSDRKAA